MLLLLLAAASAVEYFEEPARAGRVVKLLKELKANIERDAAAEEKIYNKYACWCDNTASAKASGIDQAKADIRTLSSEILALRGDRAATANDISTTATSIDSNEASTHELTLIRQKTSADAGQEISKMKQTVGALETAIRMVKAGYSAVEATAKLHKVDKALSGVVAEKVKEATNHSLVVSFLEEGGKNLVRANATYSPMSEKLLGVLQSLYGTFSANLWTAEEREATSRETFQTVLEEKSAELALLTQTVKEKDEVEAEKAQIQAAKEQQLLDLQDQITADDAFFKATVKACEDEADAWDERKSLRTEEAAGIDKALSILMSDENRDLFNRARAVRSSKLEGDRLSENLNGATRGDRIAEARFASFLQVHAVVKPAFKLARRATQHSLVQAQREEPLNVTKAMQDAAAPVVAEIDKMREDLKAEELLDIENRDWCINETGHYKYQKEEVLEYEINVLNGKIDRLKHRISKREDDVARLIQLNETLIQEMDDALGIRADENAAYITAREDDVKAVEVLNSTIEALEEFYKNNDFEMDTIPDGAGAPETTLLQKGKKKQPEFEISADQAPETVGTNNSYGGQGQATKAIVDLLTYLVEDTEWEIEKSDAAENASLTDYNNYVNRSKETLASWLQTKTNLEESNAADLVTQGEHEDLLATTNDMLDSVNAYLARIKPNCDWIGQAFEMRLEKREQEMRGLGDAKAQLLGASADGVGALVTEKTKTKVAAADAAMNIDTASTDQLLSSLDDDTKHWAQKARLAELVARHKMFSTKVAPRKSHGAPKPGVQVDETGPEVNTPAPAEPAAAAEAPAPKPTGVSEASREAADAEVAEAARKMKRNGGFKLRGLN
jgi:hypothetical protein